jgi:cell division protein FtsW
MPTSGNILQWIVVTLLGIALVMVGSASMSVGSGAEQVTVWSMLLGRPTVYALLAISVMVTVGHLDVRKFFQQRGLINPIVWLLLMSILLCGIVLIPHVGRKINGASRWLALGPLTFQPSELAKWAMVMAMAWWTAHYAGKMRRFFDGVLPVLCVLGFVCLLVIAADLGTGSLIGAVGLLMLIAAGARVWQIGLVMLPGILGIAAAIYFTPFRMKRLLAFMDPWVDPQGIGYHPIQSLIAISGGQITGRGLGNGLQKFGYLPEDTTDFIFPVICEELGVAGAVLVIGLYVALMWVGLGIVRDCRHPFGRLLGFGVLATIGLQALMNIAVVTVVVPTKGIALPLISNGGTGWIMCAASIGFLVAIDRLNRLEAAEAMGLTEAVEEEEPAAPVVTVQPVVLPPQPAAPLPALAPAMANVSTPAHPA